MNTQTKKRYTDQTPLCPRGIIRANPQFNTIINPNVAELAQLHNQEEFEQHCATCPKTALCTQKHKDNIAELFKSFKENSSN